MLADKEGCLIGALGLAYAEKLDRKEKNAFIQFKCAATLACARSPHVVHMLPSLPNAW